MKVLVTGGAGYVGSHACKALATAGYEPVVYDNLIFGHRDNVKWGPFEMGDILDHERLSAVMVRHRPQVVMHFAAFAYVGESVVDPAKYYRNNIAGSQVILDAMRRNAIAQFVFSSSCATYGIPSELPITEEMAQNPINPYGYTKWVVERMLADYGRAYGLRWAAMRYFNAAGCDPDGEIGERHDPETHAIPLALRAALGSGPTFKVFGTDYDTPDGSALRDYVHVSDLAAAHVAAIHYLSSESDSQAFNLATGRATSVLELLSAVEKATGRSVPVEMAKRRVGDPPRLLASNEKARRLLGWVPQFNDINDIVATAAAYFVREHNQNVLASTRSPNT